MKQVKQICFPLLLALLTTVSLSISVEVTESSLFEGMLYDVIDGIGLNQMIIFAALTVFYIKGWRQFIKSSRWITHILATAFSVFMLIGLSYSKLGNWDFILGNRRQLVIALIAFAGYFILFDLGISLLYHLLTRKNSFFQMAAHWKISETIRHHYSLFSFGVIAICWLPYLLMHLPGSVPYDGYWQINMFYGIEQISNHHPWVMTEFYGVLMEAGRGISDNFGVFLITLVSFLIEALCYSVVCNKLHKWKIPVWMNIGALLFFALLPPFGAYAQAVIKDSLFCGLFALFFVLYVDICISAIRREKTAKPFRTYILLFIVEILVCLTRNNGVYMILPADIILLFFVLKGNHRYVILMTICVCCSYYFVNNVLAGWVGVEPGSKREMLSIPFQQTARYLKEYPDDVTTEEREAISNVLSYDLLADYYDPETSDHVKSTFNDDATDEELKAYFSAWVSMFRRHPGVYFEATLNNTYGYYYPFYNCDVLGAYQFYIKGEPIATGDLDIHYIVPEKVRQVCDSYAEFWRDIPGLSLLVNPASYTWLLLIAGGYLIYKRKYKGLLVLAAPLLNVAICIASPVNGLLRYAMPLMACTPILICWCYVYTKKSGRDQKGEIIYGEK